MFFAKCSWTSKNSPSSATRVDHVFHVVRLLRIFGDERIERGVRAVPRIGGFAARRIIDIVRRQIADELANHGETIGIVARDEMGDAAFRIVCHRAAELLLGHVLMRHRLDHVGASDEHVGSVARHKNEIGDGRRVDRAARARAEDGADLRNHAARERVAQENIGVARERHHAFLNARAARIVEPDHGRALAHREVHDLRDLRRVRFGKRAAENGEVLREDVDEPPVDAAVAGDESVARGPLLFHPEILAVVPDEFVQLLERAFIEQQIDALARAELARFVFAFAALRSAAFFGFRVSLAKLVAAGRGASDFRLVLPLNSTGSGPPSVCRLDCTPALCFQ